jgi:hypothetical protein
MRRCARKLLLAAALACCLPLLASAQAEKAPVEEIEAVTSAAEAASKPTEKLEGVAVFIEKVQADGILISVAGTSTDPTIPRSFKIAGSSRVKVSGNGKKHWIDLRRGDLALVSYVKGDPPVARKVNVFPRVSIDPTLRAAVGLDPRKPKERTFIGYIKRKEGDELHVLSPAPVNQARRRPEIKRFIRHEETSVEVLRDSWDDLRKGDRVKIAFQKGNPRPADLIQVIWLGGEKPLPPGVATRIYDPKYDENVKDVDGIGETGPAPATPQRKLPTRKIKIPRQ